MFIKLFPVKKMKNIKGIISAKLYFRDFSMYLFSSFFPLTSLMLIKDENRTAVEIGISEIDAITQLNETLKNATSWFEANIPSINKTPHVMKRFVIETDEK